MRQKKLTKEEVARKGDEIYDRVLRRRVEPSHYGKVVAIDVQSEEYEVADSALAAAEALRARVPDAEIWFVRIGHRALHRIGPRILPA